MPGTKTLYPPCLKKASKGEACHGSKRNPCQVGNPNPAYHGYNKGPQPIKAVEILPGTEEFFEEIQPDCHKGSLYTEKQDNKILEMPGRKEPQQAENDYCHFTPKE